MVRRRSTQSAVGAASYTTKVSHGSDRQFLMTCVFRDLIKPSVRERCDARSPCVTQTAGCHSRSQLERVCLDSRASKDSNDGVHLVQVQATKLR